MDNILKQWEKSLSRQQSKQLDISLERRQFLHESYKATSGLAIASTGFISACDFSTSRRETPDLSAEPWRTFASVQQILFPDDGDGPGARQLNATAYLSFVLEAPGIDREQREFIIKGVDWLNRLARNTNDKSFSQASTKQQETLLNKVSESRSGERWLSYLLLFIFEALLSDPVYGANPAGIGWHWLEHKSGFPTPPNDKTYPELLKK